MLQCFSRLQTRQRYGIRGDMVQDALVGMLSPSFRHVQSSANPPVRPQRRSASRAAWSRRRARLTTRRMRSVRAAHPPRRSSATRRRPSRAQRPSERATVWGGPHTAHARSPFLVSWCKAAHGHCRFHYAAVREGEFARRRHLGRSFGSASKTTLG